MCRTQRDDGIRVKLIYILRQSITLQYANSSACQSFAILKGVVCLREKINGESLSRGENRGGGKGLKIRPGKAITGHFIG